MNLQAGLSEAFLAQCPDRPQDGCWLWRGPSRGKGYGAFGRSYTHRHVVEVFSGITIPKGLEVCHTCDTPACVNPLHLWLGTRSLNQRDMRAKGRASPSQSRPVRCDRQRGEQNTRAKVTEAKVREIRRGYAAGCLQRHLASRFGITQSVVSQIVNNILWNHVK